MNTDDLIELEKVTHERTPEGWSTVAAVKAWDTLPSLLEALAPSLLALAKAVEAWESCRDDLVESYAHDMIEAMWAYHFELAKLEKP